jgi:hypothetical protein
MLGPSRGGPAEGAGPERSDRGGRLVRAGGGSPGASTDADDGNREDSEMNARAGKRRIGRTLLAVTAGGAAALVPAALILTRPFAAAPWDEAPPLPRSLYERGGEGAGHGPAPVPVVSPFHLQTDPMEGLLLVNFEKDPDRVYLGFEPQAFDDAVHGRGLLVIGWRVDGRVDVFHEPGLRLDPQTYGIAGKGLHAMEERSFADATFQLGPAGARVDIGFVDLEGREVRLVVRETDTRPRRPLALLAPMGSAASDPPALPLVFVDGFHFVRRAGTEVRIEIDGRAHRGDPFPLPMDGARVHFLRYSSDPFIVTWNPDAEGRAHLLEVEEEPVGGALAATSRGVRYELEANGDRREIRRMSRREGGREVVVEFSPAFPQLLALRDGAEASGAFRISAGPTAGTVTGTWRVARRDRELHLEAIPAGGWTPGEVPRPVRLLFRVASVFRTWPATYVWHATLQLPPADQGVEGPLPLRSGWRRIE